MTAFGRVVVGIEASPGSAEALGLAQRLVATGGLLLLAAIDPQRSFRLPHGHARRPRNEALEAARSELPEELEVTCVERAAASAARGLTEIAEEQRADLLVLGSRPGPAGRIAPGRTVHRLLQGAPCAVAVAPADGGGRDRFRHVGVAYDGSPEADAALEAAYATAAGHGAAVSLFLVTPGPGGGYGGLPAPEVDRVTQDERRRAHERLDAAAEAAPAGVNPRTVVLHGEPAREIARACDGIVDLLFCGSRGYGPMQRALAGSVSEALLAAATQPVVVTPRTGRPGPADG